MGTPDSIRIRDPTRWKRYSTRQGGDAITFLQEFCGMRFPEAVDYRLAYHGRRRRKVRSASFPPNGENSARSLAPPLLIGPASLGSGGSSDSPDRNQLIPRPKPPPPREKPPFVLPPANPDQRRVFAYLRKRCVSSQVIRAFIDAEILYEDAQYHNCVFVGGDGSGQPKFASKRGTASEEIPLCSVPAYGEDSTRSIPSSSPHRNRFAGLRWGPQNSFNKTQGRELWTLQPKDDTREMEAALSALLNFAPVQVAVDEKLSANALYDSRKMALAINPHCSDSQAFVAIAAGIAQARFHDRGAIPLIAGRAVN